MSSSNRNAQPSDSTPVVPIATPNPGSMGHPLSQVDSRLSEIQYKMGELTSKIDHLIKAVDSAKLPEVVVKVENLIKTVDSTKGKVDELMSIKSMVIGGFAVVTVGIGVAAWVIKSAADYVVLQAKTPPAIMIPAPQPPAAAEFPASAPPASATAAKAKAHGKHRNSGGS